MWTGSAKTFLIVRYVVVLLVLTCLLRRTSWTVGERLIVEADVVADDDVTVEFMVATAANSTC